MENENFETTDIVLAATLSALNFQLKGLTREDGIPDDHAPGFVRYTFVFPLDNQIEDVVTQFNQDKISIEPKRFAYSYNFLKRKIHQKGGGVR